MKTIINYIPEDKNYNTTIDNISGEITAQEYAEECILNNSADYFADMTGGTLEAVVYDDSGEAVTKTYYNID